MKSRRTLRRLGLLWFMALAAVHAAEWQWSVPVGAGRAFLWIPPGCQQVRAVVLAQHNMLEEGVLEHVRFRDALAGLGIAEVWIAPPVDPVFRFDQGAGERFAGILGELATESGYGEIAHAPVVPLGHSACASFPWNFAAWNPARTLALISLKGDAPLTLMTGSGRPNPEWDGCSIEGVPALMVMGEYEWVERRLSPALEYRKRHPRSPLAMLAEPGRGHFDASTQLVDYLVLFIRKAVDARLPREPAPQAPPVLKPVDPADGWLVDRWRLNQPRRFEPAPAGQYAGDASEAFWCFDEELARATHAYRSEQIGLRPQLLGFVQQDRRIEQQNTHNQVALKFVPADDGLSFELGTTFLGEVETGSTNLARWTQLPAGSPLSHATGGGPIILSRISGPVRQTGPATFVVSLNRTWSTQDKRNRDIWLLAEHPGDAEHRSAVQQALLRLPENREGAVQRIEFSEIPNQAAGTISLRLEAVSDARLPVHFYVREGPAEIEGQTLRFTAIPPRAKFPLKITVVAWQPGRSVEPRVRAADLVERTFLLQPAP
jgi:hypothetical protein